MVSKMNEKRNSPDYKRIYKDILKRKYPHKKEECQCILEKETLSILDIITLNTTIFGLGDRDTSVFNQRHRSYNHYTIKEILSYQIKNKLNNTQLSLHFKISRNTIAKWRKMF